MGVVEHDLTDSSCGDNSDASVASIRGPCHYLRRNPTPPIGARSHTDSRSSLASEPVYGSAHRDASRRRLSEQMSWHP